MDEIEKKDLENTELQDSFLNEWIDISEKPVNIVCEQTIIEVSNILWEDKLIQLLLTSMEHWIVQLTTNGINTFELEKEIKILDIDNYVSIDKKLDKSWLEWLCSDLEMELWAIKEFEWKVVDRYFDFPDERLDNAEEKISFRIRMKTDSEWKTSYYFTIKRKEKKNGDSKALRVCYEKEYLITDVMAFQNIIKNNWFIETRRKEKERVAYSLDSIKFDIDTYKWIPTFMEIEAKTTRIAKRYIKILKVQNHETLITGSRWLFKYYDMLDEYMFTKKRT